MTGLVRALPAMSAKHLSLLAESWRPATAVEQPLPASMGQVELLLLSARLCSSGPAAIEDLERLGPTATELPLRQLMDPKKKVRSPGPAGPKKEKTKNQTYFSIS